MTELALYIVSSGQAVKWFALAQRNSSHYTYFVIWSKASLEGISPRTVLDDGVILFFKPNGPLTGFLLPPFRRLTWSDLAMLEGSLNEEVVNCCQARRKYIQWKES